MADIEFKYIRGSGVIVSNFLEDIRSHFSVPNERYEIEKKLNPLAKERFYAISKRGNFDIGMFLLIYKHVKEHFQGFSISVDTEIKDLALPKLDLVDSDIVNLGLEERYYQRDAINSIIKSGRGICKLGTGGGKSYIMATLLESLYKKDRGMSAMVFVPTLILVQQIFDDFTQYGCTFGFSKWTGTHEYDETANVVIVLNNNFLAKVEPNISKYETEIYKHIKELNNKELKIFYSEMDKENRVYNLLSTLYKVSKNKKPFNQTEESYQCLVKIRDKINNNSKYKNYIGNQFMFCDYILFDECHGINNTSKITNYIDKFVTKHKFGFTGTTSKDKMDYWKTVGIFGPVIYSKKSKELRDENYLSGASIKILKFHHKGIPDYERGIEKQKNWQKEVEFCANSSFRNNIIQKIVSQLNKNALIIVERIEQGEILYNLLQSVQNKKIYFIRGNMEDDERERIKKEMEERNDIICIAISKIFSVGVSINNIHYLFFVNIGKSFIKVIQTIGRGLRKHEAKDRVVIFDLCDDLIYSTEHLRKRIDYYEEEEFNYIIKEFHEK